MPALYWAVIPAAGSGLRMGVSTPKQYLPLAGRAVIEHVLEVFMAEPLIAGMTVALAADDPYWQCDVSHKPGKPVRVAAGGEQRAHSVLSALRTLRQQLQDDDWVLVHDAVRPCLDARDLRQLLHCMGDDPVGGILAVPLTDTLKRVDDDLFVQETLPRAKLWRAFTPQMFRYGMLVEALEACIRDGRVPTDEAAAMESRGHAVRVMEGRSDNLKITRPEDIALAEAILLQRSGVRP